MPLNLYADVDAFRRRMAQNARLDDADVIDAERMLEAASRQVDEWCGCAFYEQTETRYFDGNGCGHVRIPPLIAATSIKIDEGSDGTFEVTLQSADYWLINEGGQNQYVAPFDLLRLNEYGGQRDTFDERPKLIEIVGRWGWSRTLERLTPTATLADATTTAMTLSAAAEIPLGATLLVESEQLYVVSGAVTAYTVKRGVNGTTAAAHSAKPVDRFAYPPQVTEAVLITASRAWKRRETAYSTQVNNPVLGQYEVYRGLDPDVKELLRPFRTPNLVYA